MKNDKQEDKNGKIATTETQNENESQKQNFSDSEVAREMSSGEIAQLKTKLEESENKYKRALADYQNLEKRVRDEKSEWLKISNKEFEELAITAAKDTMACKRAGIVRKDLFSFFYGNLRTKLQSVLKKIHVEQSSVPTYNWLEEEKETNAVAMV